MKFFTVIFMLATTPAYAFHAVSEILPGGQLLICKDYGQIKKGRVVENHTRVHPGSEQNITTAKKNEFMLPEVGSKITLTHKDFHFKSKSSNNYHKEVLGTAVVVPADSLVGAQRVKRYSPNHKRATMGETKTVISLQDIGEIDKNCIVAIAENNLSLKELAAVSW